MNVAMKHGISPRSCSAVSTVGRYLSSQNSVISSVRRLDVTQRRAASAECAFPLQNASKKSLHQKSTLGANGLENNIVQKCRKQNEIDICYCTDCATEVDVPKKYLRDLKDQLQDLNSELSREKNNNQLLKRNILIAKKVVENEIGSKNEDFYNLINKASDESWKGRQEIIIDLKQKLRDLSEAVERLEGEGKGIVPRKMHGEKRDESPDITDDRKLHWCLKLERQEVWKNAERYRQHFVASRDSLRNRLDNLISKNAKWMNEACNIRNQLTVNPYKNQERLIEQIRNLEHKLKTNLEEKTEDRKKLDDLAQQICRNLKTSAELKSQILSEKVALKENENTVKSLNKDETNMHAVLEEVKKNKYTQTATMKIKLDDVEQRYSDLSKKTEQLLNQIAKNKELQENVKILQSNTSCISLIKDCLLSCADQKKNELADDRTDDRTDDSKSEIFSDNAVRSYETKQLKYQSILQVLERRNEDKLQSFFTLINETKEDVFEFLRNRYVLWKLTSDLSILRNRAKKFKKALLRPSKQKLVKRKNSSHQLIEGLDENKKSFEIRISECKSLKLLMRRVFASKEDDPDLFKICLTRNQEMFLKALQTIK